MSRPRILVAMSGGVDSSVAAARLVDRGYEVVGVTLHLWDTPDDGSVKGRCCAPEDVHDARRVADALGVPHFAFDRRVEFEREVVGPFVDAYLAAVTPSPCVRCNQLVKLPELLALADRLGAPALATGHYARIVRDPGGARLLRGRDRRKDQSYFLHAVSRGDLARLELPLGESTKEEVRAEALARGLPGATKGESQELCFVPDGHHSELVSARAAGRTRPGPIVDSTGRRVGAHGGVHSFTLGQRRGLGVAVGQRAYVVGLDASTGTVRLGSRDELAVRSAELEDVRAAEPLPGRCEVVVRYRGHPVPARLQPAGPGRLRVEFETAVHAVVPGQFAVLYSGDEVLGGGRIQAMSSWGGA